MTAKKEDVTLTRIKSYKSKGLILSTALLPLAWLAPVQEFFTHNPEAGPLLMGAWGWVVRIIARAPLVIK